MAAAPAEAIDLLERGDVEVLGLISYSSNYTFLAKVRNGGAEVLAIYKPRKGERPLWDFPEGTLAAHEVASWKVSEAAEWNIVPPTVLGSDGPLGPGSLQLFVDHDPERHYFVVLDEHPEELAVFAIFDAVVNNADRKAGHVLEDREGRLWAVDHGVTFHVEPKLRTVIWAFAEERLTPHLRAGLERLGSGLSDDGGVGTELGGLLARKEVEATLGRVEALLLEDRFLAPGSDRPLPWPLI